VSSVENKNEGKVLYVHRTACFDRNLEVLSRKGGTASIAAEKARAVMCQIMGMKERDLRKQFRFTRHGEYRIKYCGKYDLGCGYRLVFIRRNGHIVFLYVGSHDDCFRWIDRNRGVTYRIDDTRIAIQITRDPLAENKPNLDKVEENLDADEYEAQLMRRIDEKTLRKIFTGFKKIKVIDGLNSRSART
jgi:hypothetical protein